MCCLTRAVGPWKDWGVAEVVLQRQVCQAVHTAVGCKGKLKRVPRAKHCHEPRRAPVRPTGAFVRFDGSRVGQVHVHRVLETCVIQRQSQQERGPLISDQRSRMYRTVPLVVPYVMENDANRSALMQVVLPFFTSRETAWLLPVAAEGEERAQGSGSHSVNVKKQQLCNP